MLMHEMCKGQAQYSDREKRLRGPTVMCVWNHCAEMKDSQKDKDQAAVTATATEPEAAVLHTSLPPTQSLGNTSKTWDNHCQYRVASMELSEPKKYDPNVRRVLIKE